MLLVLGSPGALGRPDIVPTTLIAPAETTTAAVELHVALTQPSVAIPAAEPVCRTIAAPPQFLATQSKYDQADASRSSVAPVNAASREAVLQPIRSAIRALVAERYACLGKTARAWAEAGALDRMESEDAFLTRDRFFAEIVMALLDANAAGALQPEDRQAIAPWLHRIADSTMEYYTYRAGPNSRRNNHRYWAGLSVGAIGYLLDDPDLKAWADRSFEIGVCQVDDRGLLPLELARGSQALNYHIYALRPLMVYAGLAKAHGDHPGTTCRDGLERLVTATRSGVGDPRSFAALTGKVQAKFASEKSFSPRFQLLTLGVAAGQAELPASFLVGASSR